MPNLIRITESLFLLVAPPLARASQHLGVPGQVLPGVCATLAGWNGWLLASCWPWVSRRQGVAFFGVWALLCGGVLAAGALGPPSRSRRVVTGMVGAGLWAGYAAWLVPHPGATGFWVALAAVQLAPTYYVVQGPLAEFPV